MGSVRDASLSTTDPEAYRQFIRSLDARLAAVSSEGDLAGWMALFTDDTVLMPPLPSNVPALVGKKALRSWAQEVFDLFSIDETITTEEIQVVGDWGFSRGVYVSTAIPKAGDGPQQVSGRYMFIVRRQSDGSWKYVWGIWNLDQPTSTAAE